MNPKNYYELMAQYNQWMNRKVYAVCAQIPDADRKADRGAFFKSIHSTLNHLIYGDYAWLGRFTGRKYEFKRIGEDTFESFDEMHQARIRLDEEIIAWAQNVDEAWLAAPFHYESYIYKRSIERPAWVLVTHMFNHQTHHRGQLTTLLTQMGYDVGVTDLPWMGTDIK